MFLHEKNGYDLGPFSTNQKIVLSSSRGRGIFEDLQAWPRPWASNCILETKDVFGDSTSGKHRICQKLALNASFSGLLRLSATVCHPFTSFHTCLIIFHHFTRTTIIVILQKLKCSQMKGNQQSTYCTFTVAYSFEYR